MKRLKKLCGLLVVIGISGSGVTSFAQPKIPKEQIPSETPPEIRQQIQRLYSADPRKRAEAARRLGGQGAQAAGAVPFLIAMLDDRTVLYDAGRLVAISMTSSYGCIFSFPNTPGEKAAQALANIAIRMDRPPVAPLTAALKDRDWNVRANALRALGEMIERNREMAKVVGAPRRYLPSLKDEHREVRGCAAQVLELAGDPRATEPLMAALADRDATVRAKAASALGRIGDSRAVELLIAALKNEQEPSTVRSSAARSLGAIRDPRAVEPLIDALKDRDPQIRMAAVAITAIKDPRVLAPLTAALEDEHRQVREVAAGALGRTKDPRCLQPLMNALKDEYPNVRARAAQSLGELHDFRAVEAVIVALRDENAYVRWHAAGALGELKDLRALGPLTAAMKDPDELVRTTVRRALEETKKVKGRAIP